MVEKTLAAGFWYDLKRALPVEIGDYLVETKYGEIGIGFWSGSRFTVPRDLRGFEDVKYWAKLQRHDGTGLTYGNDNN